MTNLKTLPQIIEQIIREKDAVVANNPIGYMDRFHNRVANDPGLVMLISDDGMQIGATLSLIPKELQAEALKATIAQAIQDWEPCCCCYMDFCAAARSCCAGSMAARKCPSRKRN
jgi:hypothetical protein